MPKDIPVSNGSLLLNFDSDYRLRDIYFPYIGQENHSNGHPSLFGIWVDGQFSWIGAGWQKKLRYRENSSVTDVTLKNEGLGVELRCHDAVHFDLNVYLKEIHILNLHEKDRDVRLFFHHDLHLYGNDIGDTTYFDPWTRSIVHYKANRYFLINCCVNGKYGVEFFACGPKKLSGEQGTRKDAEDGELSANPIAWGSSDSTISIRLRLPPGGRSVAHYWIAAGTKYKEVVQLNQRVEETTPAEIIMRTSDYWVAWINKESRSFADLPPTIVNLFNRSLLVLRTQIDNQGAIIAANDSDIVRFGGDTYSYMWGRDGAFVAVAMSQAGYAEVCRRFFNFCSSVLSDEGYLFQHYNPDGSQASNWHPWLQNGEAVLPIQEDSTALVLWALWMHFERAKDIEFIRPLYTSLITRSADFLVTHRDAETLLPIASYDLWEERYGVHTFTVAAVIAGLQAAANFAKTFGDDTLATSYESAAIEIKMALTKYLYHPKLKRYARSGYRKKVGYELDEVLDVSLAGLVSLGVLDAHDLKVAQTMEAIRKQLWVKTPVGGFARYQKDPYQATSGNSKDFPGNPW
ncbi:MAG: glycoside hydrolase family 15 protein, partial [Acidobacteria bacterium]|nr:glycoside hydrolase family 15 protein [Acidobacteriota bacterium]